MIFSEPEKCGFTVYGAPSCPKCDKVKELLDNNNIKYTYIDCRPYLTNVNDKKSFFSFISTVANRKITSFPMVFNNAKIIGALYETALMVKRINKINSINNCF